MSRSVFLLAFFLCRSIRAGEWERIVANGTACNSTYLAPWENGGAVDKIANESSLWMGIPERAKKDLMAQTDNAGGDPLQLIFDRLNHAKCHSTWDAPPHAGKLRAFERLLSERQKEAESRILYDFTLGDSIDATYYIVTLPSRLCLAARVVGQLESGGAQGRVIVLHGKEIGKDACLDPFMSKTWGRPCGPRDVNSAALNEYVYPLAYGIGSDINIVFEDDAAFCASPELFVEQSKKAPVVWLGYRHRNTLGAHMLGFWRSSVPYLLALIQPFTFMPVDLYYLRSCLNPIRAAWSLGSTFPHLSLQRDTSRDPKLAERGHFQKCTFDDRHWNWLPASRH